VIRQFLLFGVIYSSVCKREEIFGDWPGLELDDKSRTHFGGLSLGLEDTVLEHILVISPVTVR